VFSKYRASAGRHLANGIKEAGLRDLSSGARRGGFAKVPTLHAKRAQSSRMNGARWRRQARRLLRYIVNRAR
jgi:hypothetical protein